LVQKGMYFTAVPYIKEYLISSGQVKDSNIDLLIDKVITEVGVRQFEVLPEAILNKSNAPTMRYISAKKYFRMEKYDLALDKLQNHISSDHPVKPFALMLEGSIYSIKNNFNRALVEYNRCVGVTESAINRNKNLNLLRQLYINKDYCIVGVARTQFAAKNYSKANMEYLDLPKDSYIWPEILFEEAWNSFYMKDYNRTLGKLVTYNAPILDYIFNPEIDVLKALAYMNLCLFNDVRATVDEYYSTYQNQVKRLDDILGSMKRDYRGYSQMIMDRLNGQKNNSSILDRLLGTVIKDPAFLELYDSFNKGMKEYNEVKLMTNGRTKKIFMGNLNISLGLQRNLIGSYVRKSIVQLKRQIEKGFEGMTYIKLEVLSKQKDILYSPLKYNSRSRGDINYLHRNDKQYFWIFNGEFWADELGDYVFALRSECGK